MSSALALGYVIDLLLIGKEVRVHTHSQKVSSSLRLKSAVDDDLVVLVSVRLEALIMSIFISFFFVSGVCTKKFRVPCYF
jgi:hypothetical protein